MDLNPLTSIIPLAQAEAVDANPAGGAAIGEAIVATAVGVGVTLAMLWLGWAHRTGRVLWLGRLAGFASRSTGMPIWAGLPSVVTLIALLTAAFGMYWDISLHISAGRDAGPFANPAHFFILGGLFGVFISGFLSIVLAGDRPSRVSVRLGPDWYAPLGGIGLLAASAFALIGFPLDDMWHRIFGQDVTLWGPTHLMLLGGAALAFVGQATLLGEAHPKSDEVERTPGISARLAAFTDRVRYPMLTGGFLIALSIFQAEFDFGVPQFRMLFGPVLVTFAAGVALVAARVYGGRGAALLAVGFYLLVRGALAVIVGPVFGEPTPYFPLYLGAAAIVEVLALLIDGRRRPWLFGAVGGLLIGTVGVLGEHLWTQVAIPIAWNGEVLREVVLLAPLTGIASGMLGAWIATAWRSPVAPAQTPRLHWGPAALSALVIAAVVGYGLQTTPEQGVSAEVELTEVSPAPDRTAQAVVRISPPEAVEGATYLNVTGWQGGGFHVDELEPVPGAAAGTYRSTEPIPVSGTWKSVIRLHRGSSLIGVPVFMPEDAAIPAPEVPASASFEREFVADHQILQREQIDGVAGWVSTVAYLVVGLITLAILLLLGWTLDRINGAYAGRPPVRGRDPEPPADGDGGEAAAAERERAPVAGGVG